MDNNRREQIEEAAAVWAVRRDGGMTPAEKAEFERWLALDPEHLIAWEEMSAAMAVVNRPRQLGLAEAAAREIGSEETRAAHRPFRQVRYVLPIFAGLAAAAVLMLAFLLRDPVHQAQHSQLGATTVVVPDKRTLEDGTLVEMSSEAAIEVVYSATKRQVRLLRGQAHFAVKSDRARPFTVTAAKMEVVAVGTEFAVSLESREVNVIVTEGRVAVATAPVLEGATAPSQEPSVGPVFASAGMRVAIPTEGVAATPPRVENLIPSQIETALAWRSPRFEFSSAPLAEVIAEFNRNSTVYLVLGNPGLGQRRVSGIFWPSNPEGFAKLIASSLGVRIEHAGPDRIVLLDP